MHLKNLRKNQLMKIKYIKYLIDHKCKLNILMYLKNMINKLVNLINYNKVNLLNYKVQLVNYK